MTWIPDHCVCNSDGLSMFFMKPVGIMPLQGNLNLTGITNYKSFYRAHKIMLCLGAYLVPISWPSNFNLPHFFVKQRIISARIFCQLYKLVFFEVEFYLNYYSDVIVALCCLKSKTSQIVTRQVLWANFDSWRHQQWCT